MNIAIACGRALQVAGKLYQLWGILTGNESLRMRGYQLVALGQMRVLGCRATALVRYCTPRQALAVQAVPIGKRRIEPYVRARGRTRTEQAITRRPFVASNLGS